MTKSVDIKEPKEEPCNPGHEQTKPRDKKDKGYLPKSKIVIRRLPPTMTKEQFLEQISPVPDHDYFNYVSADYSLNQNAFCTAYLNFIKQDDIFIFRDKFDNYVFLDAKGNEYAAVVEFALFQKTPRKKNWKDAKCGTIEEDPDYKAFLETLQNPVEVTLPSLESYLEELEIKEKELKANHGVLFVKTPLLEYVKQRKMEKQRIQEERREERRRREIERRKQREEERRKRKYEREKQIKEKIIKKCNDNSKDYPSDNSDSDTVVKVLKNPERKPEDKLSSEKSAFGNQAKKSDKSSSRQFENRNTENRKDKTPKKKTDKPHFKEDDEKGGKGNKRKSKSKLTPIESKITPEKGKLRQKPTKSEKEDHIENKGNMKKELKSDLNSESNDKLVDDVSTSTSENVNPNNETVKNSEKPDEPTSEKSDHTNKSARTDEESENKSRNSKDKPEQIVKTKNNENENAEKEKENKREKRIRNKDRPSMELYRPGMRRLAPKHSASTSPQKEVSPSSSSSPSPILQVCKSSKEKPKKEDMSEETETQ